MDLRQRDVVLRTPNNKASLESTVADCCVALERAGLEVGLDKTHSSSSIDLEGDVLHVRGQDTKWR